MNRFLCHQSIEDVFPDKNKTDLEKLKTKLSEKMKGMDGNPGQILTNEEMTSIKTSAQVYRKYAYDIFCRWFFLEQANA